MDEQITLSRQAGPSLSRWSRFAPATKTASSPGTASRWASWKCAGRGSPAATTIGPTRPTSFTEDGWFRTGDIVAIDQFGCLHLQDRAKDVIKSGGEWISSVALENALMGHPAVAEAAVIPADASQVGRAAAGDRGAQESRSTATPEELIEFIEPQFAKWWLPDAVEFASEIPRTSAGKFLKTALREKYGDYYERTAS